MRKRWGALVLVSAGMVVGAAHAEDGSQGWLRYAPLSANAQRQYAALPARVVALDDTAMGQNASAELKRGLGSMLGREIASATKIADGDALVVGTTEEIRGVFPAWHAPSAIGDEGFAIARVPHGGHSYWVIAGKDGHGELYGVFHVLRQIAMEKPMLADTESPSAPIRWTDEWDNFDGSIERGWAGKSIFFENGHVRSDLTRVGEYGRLLASIGINGVAINNVNANPKTLDSGMLKLIARIADAFRPWGVRISLAVPMASPQDVGGLKTFDPLDPEVVAWWQKKTDEIYTLIPDFAGFLVKADSEGQRGPAQYGRTPADAANVLARPLKAHGGVVMYRGFVYNNHLDWTDMKADRARAGYDNFRYLDGKFEPNVVIQIKNGPIDFQVREPVSPLFAALRHTNEAIELQTTQEYTGQAHHMVFLVPMWKTYLDTDLRVDNRPSLLKTIVEGKVFHRPLSGFVSVVNVGLDENWMRHPMSMANVYGYGRLAWNPDLSSQEIIDEWTRMTWGNNPLVDSTIDKLNLESWHAYEEYTGPLGVGGLTNITGPHYGPGIESAERNGWGQWIRADHEGIGMDRTVATGTGYIGQYPPELAAKYESLKTCPDNLLLFMHHVPYNYVLHDGRTVVQYVYDTHYDGAKIAASYVWEWEKLKGLIDEERYEKTLAMLQYQAGHADVWRDAVDQWFQKMSGIPDKLGRVGHDPNRVEAESMQAQGYTVADMTPYWENASGGKFVTCGETQGCTLKVNLNRPAGAYSIAVQYFDLANNVSNFELLLDGQRIGQWKADDTLPGRGPSGDNLTRYTVSGVHLKPGDTLELRGIPDGREQAPVDYIEITPLETRAQ
ncbi:MAG TPA: alpha-glucuronidase family glycosyl hydrolase [Acidobacteriaceae bacterium]|nr:alpha-glucuronidase family glycosyl hydrolase [Acidobacteriaceae bacterium]